MIGLGLAAFTLFRRDEADEGESDLVNSSMLASGTGDTGQALGAIPTIEPVAGINPDPVVVPVSDADVELTNVPIGALPIIPVTPVVITPPVVMQGEEAIRQLGIRTDPDEVLLVNPKLYIQQVSIPGESGVGEFTSITMNEGVQIVSGGANLGGAYFTDLETLAIARDQGYFDTPTWEQGIGPNVFNPLPEVQQSIQTLAAMTAPPQLEVIPASPKWSDPWIIRQQVDADIGI